MKSLREFVAALALLLCVSNAGATSYTYDSLNRLTSVDYGGGNSITYSYDAAGNRLSVVVTSIAGVAGPPTGVTAVVGNGQATISFTPPISDGGSPITSYTATASPGGGTGGCNSPCTSIVVSGLINGTPYTFTVVANNALGAGAASQPSVSVIPVNRSYTAADPVLPARGSITAVLNGGGIGCSFDYTKYIPAAGAPSSPPAGSGPTYVLYLYGLFSFTTVGCDAGSAITVAVTYPEVLSTAMQYWQFGPTAGNATPHWYVRPATIVGDQATVTLTDAGTGDDDLTSNGVIVSKGGLGIAPWDVMWRKSDGTNATWQFTGPGPTQFTPAFPPGVPTTWQAKGAGDVNGDGILDVVWFEPSSGQVATWLMSSPAAISSPTFPASVGTGSSWVLSGIGDINGDGRADLVWRDSGTGQALVWLMAATGTVASTLDLGVVPLSYALRGVGDFNGDGIGDLLWFQASDGQVAVWLMAANGTHTAAFPGAVGPGTWLPYRVGDFDSDGKADLFWRDAASGMTVVWYMNGGIIADFDFFVSVPLADWDLGSVGDFDLDGRADVMWYAPGNGNVVRWLMEGRHVTPTIESLPGVGTGWQMVP